MVLEMSLTALSGAPVGTTGIGNVSVSVMSGQGGVRGMGTARSGVAMGAEVSPPHGERKILSSGAGGNEGRAAGVVRVTAGIRTGRGGVGDRVESSGISIAPRGRRNSLSSGVGGSRRPGARAGEAGSSEGGMMRGSSSRGAGSGGAGGWIVGIGSKPCGAGNGGSGDLTMSGQGGGRSNEAWAGGGKCSAGDTIEAGAGAVASRVWNSRADVGDGEAPAGGANGAWDSSGRVASGAVDRALASPIMARLGGSKGGAYSEPGRAGNDSEAFVTRVTADGGSDPSPGRQQSSSLGFNCVPSGTGGGRIKGAQVGGRVNRAAGRGGLAGTGAGSNGVIGAGVGGMIASTGMNEGVLDSNSALAGACKGLGTGVGRIKRRRGTAAGTCSKQTWTGNRGAAAAAGRTGEGRGAGAGAMATGGAWSSDSALARWA